MPDDLLTAAPDNTDPAPTDPTGDPAPAGDPKPETPPADPAPADPPADPAADPGPADPEGDPPADDYGQWTLPEGVELDQKMSEAFAAKAKELGLTKEQAQEIVDLQAQSIKEADEAFQAEAQEWVDKAKSDQEYGGAKFDENLAMANKALKTYGTDDLVDVLKGSGLGNHPEVVRFMYRVGKTLGEDQFHDGDPPQHKPPESLQDALYG